MIYLPFLNDTKKVGFLGNQMFLIAAALGTGKEIAIPKNWIYREWFPNLWRYEHKMDSLPELRYREQFFHYVKIPDMAADFVLEGYFQSEKYFENAAESIRKMFTTYPIVKRDMVSIHVRRGDYKGKFNGYYVDLCETDYYKKAMKFFGDCHFEVFSDDIPFCKSYFGNKVSYADSCYPIVDMREMAQCKGHIIANSSFSWWGAWLGGKYDMTIAPCKWFTGVNLKHDTKDLIPDRWITL